jgi:3-oxoacyl-[acyl-carrier-protein] synthase II
MASNFGEGIVISGLGAVSALGASSDALWAAIDEGRDGIRPIKRFSTEGFAVTLGAMVPGFDAVEHASQPGGRALCVDFAKAAAREAMASARLPSGVGEQASIPAHRVALVMGTSLGDHTEGLHALTEDVGDALGALGPRITISTACSSSTNALGLGADLLEAGAADLVLAGGTDTLTPDIFAGFYALGLLSLEKCAPFSAPTGTTLGEGAGFLVLERASAARRRGAPSFGRLLGYGLSADAYHATAPDPSGGGVARAIRGALQKAGLDPAAIDYVNAHGTGTQANDPAEWRALEVVFGAHAARLPVSSTKSFLGHAQGAAGVLETIATLLAMRRGALPPTLHFKNPRPRSPADPVAQDRPRPADVRYAVCTNSAFGGANAAVVVGAATLEVPRDPASGLDLSRGVLVLGAGAVGPHGLELDALCRMLGSGKRLSGRVPPFRIEDVIKAADPRGLDPSSRFLSAAAARALADAGVTVRGPLRERAGLFVGLRWASPHSVDEYKASVEARGLRHLSAPAFTRLVLNASAGACSKLLSLKGPITALTTGRGSGLVAVVYAARSLATRRDADLLIAGGLDELGEKKVPDVGAAAAEPAMDDCEGAACLVLAAEDAGITHSAPAVRMAGWGIAGPGRLDEAIEQAAAMARLDAASLRRASEWAAQVGGAHAAGPVFACGVATAALRREMAGAFLIADAGGGSASAAVILTCARPTSGPTHDGRQEDHGS